MPPSLGPLTRRPLPSAPPGWPGREPVYEALSYEGGVARPGVLAPGGDPLEPPLA